MENDRQSQTSGEASATVVSEESHTEDHAHFVLSKMEAANRQIEADAKSANSILQSQAQGQSTQASPERQPMSGGQSADEEAAYWSAWATMIQEWETAKRNKDALREMTKKGIPQPLRAIAWQLLSNAQDSTLKNGYVSLIVKNSPFDKAIQRDLARTFPNHEFFRTKPKRSVSCNEEDGETPDAAAHMNDSRASTISLCEGQESLFNVLKAYSLVDSEVGYCQGSAFIAGLLLLQLPEEEAFCVFAKLMQEYRLRELYKPAMAELGLCIFQLENLLQEHVPRLYIHFTSIGFRTTIFATSWFLTLFNTTFSFDVCFRLMDLFLLDGMDVIFRVALAILVLSEHDLLQLDMESANNYMQTLSSTYESQADTLIQVAYDQQKVRINARSMKKWEKEYVTFQNKQEEERIEMRRLRTETKLLRQQLEYVERENARIADALDQYQLSTKEATDEINRLRAQVRKLKAPKNSVASCSYEHNMHANVALPGSHARAASSSVSVSPRELTPSASPSIQHSSRCAPFKHAAEVGRPCSDCPRNCAECQKAGAAYSKETRILIEELQSELVTSRLKEAELSITVRELRERVGELEEENRTLQRKPKAEVLTLQDELISVKLREAETNLNLKDLELKLNNIQKLWKARDHLVNKLQPPDSATSPESGAPASGFGSSQTQAQSVKSKMSNSASFSFGFLSSLSSIGQSGSVDNNSTRTVIELQEELITSRLKEAESAAELRSMQKRVMELESQTQLVQRQLGRIEDENGELRERAAEHESMRKRASNECRTLEMRLAEAETREKQKDVQFRILEVELRAQLADLESRLAASEIRALENTVANSCVRTDNSQMTMSTMSTSMFDPECYRLQLTQSIIGELPDCGPEKPPSAHSYGDSLLKGKSEFGGDATRNGADSTLSVKTAIPTLERVQQIMERVSPYEKYGRLTSACTALENEPE